MITFQNAGFRYSGATEPALTGVTLTVAPGSVVLVTGPSGCGKTTLVRLANGLCPHFYKGFQTGSVTVNGIANPVRPLEVIARDAGTLFQDPESQFFALTVEEELAFSLEWQDLTEEERAARLAGRLALYGLEAVRAHELSALSEGQKQKTGLAAVTLAGAKALILDEPTANLDVESTERLADELLRLKAEGYALLVADHRLAWLQGVADQVLVLADGRPVWEGKLENLTPALCRELGLRTPQAADPRGTLPEVAHEALEGAPVAVEGLTFAYGKKTAPVFDNLCFTLPVGVTALLGPNGIGKTTLARVLCGLEKRAAGTVRLGDTVCPPRQMLQHVSLVLQNADHQLCMSSVLAEVRTALRFAGQPDSERAAFAILEELDLAGLADRHPQSLSGGQKQRLVIACALAKAPKILLLDEPTSGLDGRNMERIARILEKLTLRGTAVLVITHDTELLSRVCTRALRLPF